MKLLRGGKKKRKKVVANARAECLCFQHCPASDIPDESCMLSHCLSHTGSNCCTDVISTGSCGSTPRALWSLDIPAHMYFDST